jgi:hypothetical protein
MKQWREQSPHLIRQLEHWLPLAQLESNRLGLQLTPDELEAVVKSAAPAFSVVVSSVGARAVLWHHLRRIQELQQS